MVDWLIITVIILIISSVIAIAWASGINEMHRDHPDYKGDDFLNYKQEEDNK